MKSMSLSAVLHRMVLQTTPEAIVAEAVPHLENPVILADLSLHILAITEDPSIDDPRWRELSASRMMPMNLMNLSLYGDALKTGSPIVSTDATGLPIVRCAVAQDGNLMAYLLSPCYHGAPAQEALDLLQLTADLCSLRYQQRLSGPLAADRPEHFISALMDGTITDEQLIRDRCRQFGWHLTVPYRVISVRGTDPDEMERGEGYLRQSRRETELRHLFPDAEVFLYGEQIKMLNSQPEDPLREALFLEDLTEWLTERNMVAGISQPGRYLSRMSNLHRQAMKALQLGTLLMGSGPLFSYDRYSIYHVLEVCEDKIDLLDLCHRGVLTLERYDRQHGTALMGTLHAYLAHEMNARVTAEALYIHRNTLSKRLEKINDLIMADLTDSETVFHLLFSLRIIEYYGAARRRSEFESWVDRMPTLRHK